MLDFLLSYLWIIQSLRGLWYMIQLFGEDPKGLTRERYLGGLTSLPRIVIPGNFPAHVLCAPDPFAPDLSTM